MFTTSVVQSCLEGLVGFLQPTDPAYPPIQSSLLATASGQTLSHPLCVMENLYNVAPEFGSFEYEAWSVATAYEKGQRVAASGKTWEARAQLAANSTLAPPLALDSWEEINPFSAWIKQVYGQACVNLLNTVIREKKLHTAARSLLESQQLYQGPGAAYNTIIKKGRFLGFEIGLTSTEGLAMRIDKIGMQVDTPQTLTLYLYNSSQAVAVATFDVNIATASSFAWQPIADAVIGYMHNDTDSDSVWYLGYYEEDLNGQAIGKEMNISSAPCLSCDQFNISSYNKWSRYTWLNAIEVPETALSPTRDLFNTTKASRVNTSNWGMNLSVSVMCDLSNVACANKMLLADGLAMQLALEFLQHIAFNTRTNVISDKTKQLAMAELDDNEKSGSFKSQYVKAVRALSLDLSGLNVACMPCSTRSTIRKTAI